MLKRMTITLTTAVLAAAALSGCTTSAESSTTTDSTEPAPAETTAAAAVLGTATSPLGEIITDDAGYTIYTFKMDKQDSGTSNCYDECATTWPAVEASDTSSPEGITGEIGSLTRTDGTTQLTVDGWPVYRFAKDTEPGQVNGQGVKDAWYVLQPDGTINMEAATEGAATPAS